MRLDDAIDRLMGRVSPDGFPPWISVSDAAQQARFAVPREALTLPVGSESWSLALIPPPAARPDAPLTVSLTLGAETALLIAPAALVERLARAVEPTIDPGRLDSDLLAMLLELALEPGIETLEEQLKRPVVFQDTGATARDPVLWAALAAPEGERYPVGIHVLATTAERLTDLWQQRAPEAGTMPCGAVLAIRFGASRMRLADLRGLAPGDAILPDRMIDSGAAALAVLGEHIAVPVTVDQDRRAWPTGPMRRDIALAHGDFLMAPTDGETDAADTRLIDDADIDETPVELVFELGRKHLTIAEMRSLGVGAPLPLDRVIDAAVDIFAGGRRIGAGEVVQIGDRVGVRITRLGATQ